MHSKIIGFIGGGNMAASLIGGLVATGHDPDQILVAEPNEARRDQLAADHGVIALASNTEVAAQSDILLLAVKPNVMRDILTELAETVRVRRPLVITIAAGLPLRLYRELLGDGIPLVRAMPNTPSLVRAGMTGAVIEDAGVTVAKGLATAVLGAVGEVRWFDADAALDQVTAVSGSGPAYFFYLMECMQASAEKLGLDADLARDLVLHTAFGAAKLALGSDVPPAELRARVTSPGGTTAQALAVLQNGDLPQLVDNALNAAWQRAQDMSRDA